MVHALLTAEALEIGYSRASFAPLDLRIDAGEFVCLLGRNGAGKTTLVRTLLGLVPPVAGRVSRDATLRCAYLAQRATFDELYPMSARDVIAMGAERGVSFLRPLSRTLDVVDQVIERFQLGELGPRRYRDLSEGQKQRVHLARVFAAVPRFAVLDEPTSAMDQLAEASAYAALDDLRATHEAAVVLVTHDLTLARTRADRLLFLDDVERRIHVGLPSEIFTSRALRARYEFDAGGAVRP
ncbi:MAG TPA: ATP-binding cassette domain-containing protein [Polyangiaceae bacterium]|nr:ATP-binding cassette domain-containing protein [Polyangiaceae bacterium]